VEALDASYGTSCLAAPLAQQGLFVGGAELQSPAL
jgi:hypothetical protein